MLQWIMHLFSILRMNLRLPRTKHGLWHYIIWEAGVSFREHCLQYFSVLSCFCWLQTPVYFKKCKICFPGKCLSAIIFKGHRPIVIFFLFASMLKKNFRVMASLKNSVTSYKWAVKLSLLWAFTRTCRCRCFFTFPLLLWTNFIICNKTLHE